MLQPEGQDRGGKDGKGKGRGPETGAERLGVPAGSPLILPHSLRRMRSPPLPGGRLGIGAVLIWDSSPGFLVESPTFVFLPPSKPVGPGLSGKAAPTKRGSSGENFGAQEKAMSTRRDSRIAEQACSTGPGRGSGKALRGQTTGQVLLPQWPELKALCPPGSGPPGERSLGSSIRGASTGSRPPWRAPGRGCLSKEKHKTNNKYFSLLSPPKTAIIMEISGRSECRRGRNTCVAIKPNSY